MFPQLAAAGLLYAFVADATGATSAPPKAISRLTSTCCRAPSKRASRSDLGPSYLFVAPDAVVAPGAKVVPPAHVAGGTTLAPGSRVGPLAVIGAGCVVEAGAEITESVVQDGVTVGPKPRSSAASW